MHTYTYQLQKNQFEKSIPSRSDRNVYHWSFITSTPTQLIEGGAFGTLLYVLDLTIIETSVLVLYL